MYLHSWKLQMTAAGAAGVVEGAIASTWTAPDPFGALNDWAPAQPQVGHSDTGIVTHWHIRTYTCTRTHAGDRVVGAAVFGGGRVDPRGVGGKALGWCWWRVAEKRGNVCNGRRLNLVVARGRDDMASTQALLRANRTISTKSGSIKPLSSPPPSSGIGRLVLWCASTPDK